MPPEKPVIHDQKEQAKRISCEQFSFYTFHPVMGYPLIPENSLLSYMGKDAYFHPGARDMSLHSVDRFIEKTRAGIGDPFAYFTAGRIQHLQQDAIFARKAFGPAVLEHAREKGMDTTLSSTEANAVLRTYSTNLEEEFSSRYGRFKPDGWTVYPTRNDGRPILLVPETRTSGDVVFHAVGLNVLHDQDPEFLPQQIREYEEKYAMGILANTIAYNRAMHTVSETEMLPEFYLELAQLSTQDQHQETLSMSIYLTLLTRLGGYNQTVRDFRETTVERTLTLSNGGYARIEDVLTHKAGCPSETDTSRERTIAAIRGHTALASVDLEAAIGNEIQEDSSPFAGVLKYPASYTYEIAEGEQRNREKRNYWRKMGQFLNKTQNITDRGELTSALAQDIPKAHETLTQFQNWLEWDYGNFDSFLDGAVRRLSRHSGRINMQQVNQALHEQLAIEGPRAIGASGNFDGITIPYHGQEVSITNLHLRTLLPLIIIQAYQTHTQKQKDRHTYSNILRDEDKRLAQNLHSLREELTNSAEARVSEHEKLLQATEERKEIIALFKHQTGITEDEISHLIDLARVEGKGSNDLRFMLYKALFTALYLEKQGMVNTNSAHFISFLRTLFPRFPAPVWENLHPWSEQVPQGRVELEAGKEVTVNDLHEEE